MQISESILGGLRDHFHERYPRAAVRVHEVPSDEEEDSYYDVNSPGLWIEARVLANSVQVIIERNGQGAYVRTCRAGCIGPMSQLDISNPNSFGLLDAIADSLLR